MTMEENLKNIKTNHKKDVDIPEELLDFTKLI